MVGLVTVPPLPRGNGRGVAAVFVVKGAEARQLLPRLVVAPLRRILLMSNTFLTNLLVFMVLRLRSPLAQHLLLLRQFRLEEVLLSLLSEPTHLSLLLSLPPVLWCPQRRNLHLAPRDRS